MTADLANPLGLVRTLMFATEADIPPGEHFVLLDGVRGSFGLTEQDGVELPPKAKSWAWSSGLLHHVTMTRDHVIVERWDRPDVERYTKQSVIDRLDRFYKHIADSRASSNRTIAGHAVDSFRRLRSGFAETKQADALLSFLLILGATIRTPDGSLAFDDPEDIAKEFGLGARAPELMKTLSHELVRHFISGFRQPLMPEPQQLETMTSLMVRHAGALVFQEAHFDLVRRGQNDMFDVPAPAVVGHDASGSGVHFTPPGLARAVVEQSLDAYGDLPSELTILDAACGSGSILYEALRTLRDRGYQGHINLVGFDESMYAVQMTRFLLSAAKRDWPNTNFSIMIERRNSIDSSPWPSANIVLMNPPFVSLRDLTSEQRRLLSSVLGNYAKGRPDLSMAFVERGLQSLSAGGVLGTLVPAGVLSMTYAEDWRRHLLDEASVSFLAIFSELGLFRLATVETGCIVLRKSVDSDRPLYRSLWVGEKRDATPEALRILRRATGRPASDVRSDLWSLTEMPTKTLKDGINWRPSPQTLRREQEKIESYVATTVGSLFDVKQGALPAPREAFILSDDKWRSLPGREQRWFRRIAENQNIRGGQILPGARIFYPKSAELPMLDSEESLLSEVPEFGSHLLKFKPVLSKRRGKQDRWWELGEDRKWLRVPSKKIVSSYFGQAGSFAYDEDGDRVVVQGYGWLPKWRPVKTIQGDYILTAYVALFNSAMFVELLGEICPTVGGGQLNLSKRYSERVRLPDLTGRVLAAPGDRIVEALSYFGKVISESGLSAAPRSKIEELTRSLYGL